MDALGVNRISMEESIVTTPPDTALLRRLAAECREQEDTAEDLSLNLPAVARALEAAAEMAERMADLERDPERITGYHRAKQEECAELEAALKKSQALRWDLTAERDAARAEVDCLRAQLHEATRQRDATWQEAQQILEQLTEVVEQRDVYRERSQQLAARVAELESRSGP